LNSCSASVALTGLACGAVDWLLSIGGPKEIVAFMLDVGVAIAE
jgi:hypothetical protein